MPIDDQRDPPRPGLNDPARLRALSNTGLGPEADAALDRFTRMVRRVLGVPVALVSLVDDCRQVFPGAAGLAEPWQRTRQTGLTHSFCQHVVLSAEPLVVTDARGDARVCDNLAISDLGVVGYAGTPLTDDDGNILGSLCAIDTEPRQWTGDELDMLTDLAAACSAELRLRIAVHRAERSRLTAERALTERERAEADARELTGAVDTALLRSQLLLRASETLLGAATVTDVVAAVARLVSGDLAPAHVAVMLRDDQRGRLDLVTTHPLPPGTPAHWIRTSLDSDQPAAVAVRSRRPVFLGDRDVITVTFPQIAGDLGPLGFHALVCAPLIGTLGVLGTLRFAWNEPHQFDTGERAVITTLAGYVTQALERALHLQSRVAAAETLQRAMLPHLPTVTRYQLAARYRTADTGEHVGGDWYDAVDDDDGRLALVIGDVNGHDMTAAAQMGQLRSMLRAYLVDRHEPPSALLRRLDTANHALGEPTIATAIVAFIDRMRDGTHRLQWSNAGHPPPILLMPGGTVVSLPGRDLLLGARLRTPRRSLTLPLLPGSTLLLHTDGLIETRTATVDDGTDRLHAHLRGRDGVPLDELVADLVDHVPVEHQDDVAVLGLRIPADG